jgi:hypothetical protein
VTIRCLFGDFPAAFHEVCCRVSLKPIFYGDCERRTTQDFPKVLPPTKLPPAFRREGAKQKRTDKDLAILLARLILLLTLFVLTLFSLAILRVVLVLTFLRFLVLVTVLILLLSLLVLGVSHFGPPYN